MITEEVQEAKELLEGREFVSYLEAY